MNIKWSIVLAFLSAVPWSGGQVVNLHILAAEGDTRTLATRLELGDDPNERTSKRLTPLHFAARLGQDHAIRLLLEHGADPNAMGSKRRTPLHYAAEGGHVEATRILLEVGADPNAGIRTLRSGKTPLHLAVEGDRTRVAVLLLERGANPNRIAMYGLMENHTPLELAMLRWNPDMAYLLLAHGANFGGLLRDAPRGDVQKLADHTGHELLQLLLLDPVGHVFARDVYLPGPSAPAVAESEPTPPSGGASPQIAPNPASPSWLDGAGSRRQQRELAADESDSLATAGQPRPSQVPAIEEESVEPDSSADRTWMPGLGNSLRSEDSFLGGVSRGPQPERSGPETAADRESRIRAFRIWAWDYLQALPNFICTQITTRFRRQFMVYPNGEPWTKSREAVARVQWVDGRESYRTVSVNGKPSKKPWVFANGGSSGRFASLIEDMAKPYSTALFTHGGEDVVGSRAADVFNVANSRGFTLHKGARSNGTVKDPAVVGYEGKVYVDKESSVLLRFDVDRFINPPEWNRSAENTMRYDYGPVDIGGKSYWLPVRVEETSTERITDKWYRTQSRSVSTWINCRKFGAESELVFQ